MSSFFRVTICAGAAALMCLLSPAEDAGAQRIGVALSGGGARGFAHIGVLRVLEEEGIPIDVITGSSMGSIIGGLYAVGYSPDDLERIGVAQDWDELFAVSAPRSRRPVRLKAPADEYIISLAIRHGRPALPSSLVSGQQVSKLLARLTIPYHGTLDFRELPIPFAAVATDLETGEGVRLDSGHLAAAIRASVSIPSALAPVMIDGRALIDGGVARNLPAEDARALGADVVLCIDTGRKQQLADSLESITDVLNQALGFAIDEHVEAQKAYCDLYLKPWLANAMVTDFGSIETLISQGYAAADSSRAQLRALHTRDGSADRRDTTAVDRIGERAYFVGRARAEGVDAVEERRMVAALRLELPGEHSLPQIEAAVDRIYASGPYRQVIYRILPDSGGAGDVLVLDASRHNEGRLGLDLRYDSRYKTSLLLSGTGRKRVGYGSTLGASLRLGEMAMLDVEYLMPLAYRRHLSLTLDGEWKRVPFDRFDDGERTGQFQADAVQIGSYFGVVPVGRWSLSAGLHAEYYGVDQRIGSAEFFQDGDAAVGPEAAVNLDSHDRSDFPTRGHRVSVEAFAALDPVSSTPFSRVIADWQPRWRVSERATITARLSVGTSAGDLPLHYRFYLGGAFDQPVLDGRLIPLNGASTQELSGEKLQAVAAGIQLRITGDWFISGQWNAGRTGSAWRRPLEGFRPGFGLTIGRRTMSIPAVLTVSTRGLTGPYELSINLGHVF